MRDLIEILEENGFSLEESVYFEDSMMHFPISAKGEWSIRIESTDKDSFEKIIKYNETLEILKKDTKYQRIVEELSQLQPAANEKVDLKSDISLKRADLRQQKRLMMDSFKKTAMQSVFGQFSEKPVSVCYKGGVKAFSLKELENIFYKSVLEKKRTEYSDLEGRPFFCNSIERIKEIYSGKLIQKNNIVNHRQGHDNNTVIGIEGGSCLVGNDEMIFHFMMKDGNIRSFDFNNMQEIKEHSTVASDVTTTELWDFMEEEWDNIKKARVECVKEKITLDEYEAIEFLFLLQPSDDTRIVISIPDMSYEKSFKEIFEKLPENIYKPFYDEFIKECNRISDISLEWIRYFIDKYKKTEGLDVEIFHRRNKQLMEIFENSREKYLSDYAKRHATKRGGALGSVLDYICMPALPYYIWGIKDCVEINRLEEYPSIEKCRRIHKGDVHIEPFLYPQKVCPGGETSAFYAKRDKKIYIDKEEVYKRQ